MENEPEQYHDLQDAMASSSSGCQLILSLIENVVTQSSINNFLARFLNQISGHTFPALMFLMDRVMSMFVAAASLSSIPLLF